MKYEGRLYGKLGRRYIPLSLTSFDIDEMEYENEVMKEHLVKLIGVFVIPPQPQAGREPTAFPSPPIPFDFDQSGAVHTSFKFDQSICTECGKPVLSADGTMDDTHAHCYPTTP